MIHLSFPEPSIAVVELDVAPANVLSMAERTRLREVLATIEAERTVRVLVLAGRNGMFCAGDDLAESLTRDVGAQREAVLDFLEVADLVAASRLPVIAAIDGWCVAGGLELALACDIRLASDRSNFGASAVRMGLTASAERLVRLIGEARAKAHLLTGTPFDAARALTDGVVAEVHTAEALMEAALGMARTIASRGPLAVEAAKRVASGRASTRDEVRGLTASADHAEARAAFMAKRPPVFQGR